MTGLLPFVIDIYKSDGCTYSYRISYHLMAETAEEILIKYNDFLETKAKIKADHDAYRKMLHEKFTVGQKMPYVDVYKKYEDWVASASQPIPDAFTLHGFHFDPYEHSEPLDGSEIFPLDQWLQLEYASNCIK